MIHDILIDKFWGNGMMEVEIGRARDTHGGRRDASISWQERAKERQTSKAEPKRQDSLTFYMAQLSWTQL
jgi:hypothetical protein